MATTTTVAAWRAAFYSALSTALHPTVHVSYGRPTQPRKELVVLGKTTEVDVEQMALRQTRTRRDETYTTEIHVEVQSKATAQASETRAAAIVADIEDLLANNPLVGAVDGVLWAILRTADWDTIYNGEQARTDVTLEIEVRAQLT